MLIQIQKMKMHMEAALLTMDQVLTSNELTMAATAAIPGVALSCLAGYSFYWMFIKTKAPRNKSSEQLQLRLAFGDIERAINSLISQVKESDNFEYFSGPIYNDAEDLSHSPFTPEERPPLELTDQSQTHSESELEPEMEEESELREEREEQGQIEGGISNLARDELLILRYNGLLIFQVTGNCPWHLQLFTYTRL